MNRYDIEKTLFISDLDGTLLRSDGTLSQKAADTINKMTARGLKFSFATARSYHTAMQVASSITADIPIVLHDGVFIRECITGEYLRRNLLPSPERIRKVFEEYGLSPFVYSEQNGIQRYTYLPDRIPRESAEYQTKRINDPRDNPISDESHLWVGDIFYVLCITNDPRAQLIYERLCKDYSCLYAADYYSGDKWLEIYSPDASKAQAIMQLRDILGCERVVVFGDGENDVSMFDAANEAYAVSNAVTALKARADDIIGSNDDDAVIRWLEENIIFNDRDV